MPPLIFVSYHRRMEAAIKNDISIEFISVNMSSSLYLQYFLPGITLPYCFGDFCLIVMT